MPCEAPVMIATFFDSEAGGVVRPQGQEDARLKCDVLRLRNLWLHMMSLHGPPADRTRDPDRRPR